MPAKDPQYASGAEQRPELDRHLQSSVKGLHIIGAANGSPLLKTSINEGVQAVRSLSRLMPPAGDDGVEDLIIIGAGPAGLAAALEADKRGYRFKVLEQGRPLHTILNFPEGKKIYAEPAMLATLGDIDLQDSNKEELLAAWEPYLQRIEIERGFDVTGIRKKDNRFEVTGKDGRVLSSRRVILAIGRMGNPRKLGIPGEDLPCVYTALLNPGKYRGKEIVVIGGGNSAVEAALALAGQNRVTLAYRGEGFHRVSKINGNLLDRAKAAGKLQVLTRAEPIELRRGEIDLQVAGSKQTFERDIAFVLIGADPPTGFLKRLGVFFEGQVSLRLLPKFLWVFALVYAIYAVKGGRWPFAGVYHALEAAHVSPALLYGVAYTVLVTWFGTLAIRKYRDDPYQTRRYTSLIACQWLIYFLLPWTLYYSGHTEWWRSWAVSLTYPLGYYGLWDPARALFAGSVMPWTVAILLAFLVVHPIVAAFHGKRFCSWVCPCGGMADTVGDSFRHKSPRGQAIRRLESAETVVLIATIACSILFVSGYRGWLDPGSVKNTYKLVVDFGLASIVAITLYPFYGNRVWCRFFCPLSKWMELWGRWTGGKLAIVSNDECISCGECTRYCQMGIDVRAFASREQPLSNATTCCIFCGICVTVCPVDVLSVERSRRSPTGR